MKQWLKDAVFYEIYPQSFYDTNGDGIGDLKGIIEKLDYIKELGCNALWINPCFDSPFKDAGYDVRDYKLIAPRYGTNADAKALFEAAHAKGIHVLLVCVCHISRMEIDTASLFSIFLDQICRIFMKVNDRHTSLFPYLKNSLCMLC